MFHPAITINWINSLVISEEADNKPAKAPIIREPKNANAIYLGKLTRNLLGALLENVNINCPAYATRVTIKYKLAIIKEVSHDTLIQ